MLMLQLAADPLLDKVWGVLVVGLVGGALSGALGLIGFVAVMRRFMDKEIPAQLAAVNSSVQALHADLEALAKELVQMRRDVDRHGYQIQTLEEWRRRDEGRPNG